MQQKLPFGIIILFTLILAACGTVGEPLPTETPRDTAVPTITPTPAPPTITPTPTITSTPTDTPTPTLTPTVIYSPEPREVEFEADDGQTLQGMYFPSDESPAPVIVLMHWSRGDQGEWDVIARWLQNRGLMEDVKAGGDPWLNPGWFPEMTDAVSPAVFTFTFRDCEGGCKSYPAGGWLRDARAAMHTASQLEGVDQNRVLAAGASIGADGAVNGCYWMNETQPGTCLGAFAISPGSYLTVAYEDAAHELLGDDPPRSLWCLFGKRDDAAQETCQSVPEATLVDYGFTPRHGMELITPELDAPVLSHLMRFVESSLQGTGEGE